MPSERQQPNNVRLQGTVGQPLFLRPAAGDTPSGQQPNLVSAQVFGLGQPSSNGPAAGVLLSGQHPNLLLMHLATLGLQILLVLVLVQSHGMLTVDSSPVSVEPSDVLSVVAVSSVGVDSSVTVDSVSLMAVDPASVVSLDS